MNVLPDLPELHGHWDYIPSEKGDSTQRKILYNVGAALTVWETLESNLADLFALFLQSPTIAAQRAYGVIATHRARRDMLKAASEVYFRDKTEEAPYKFFALLMRHIETASTIRNNIAHGVSVSLESHSVRKTKTGALSKRKVKLLSNNYFLIPPRYNSSRTSAFPNLKNYAKHGEYTWFQIDYRYTSDDIWFFGTRFQTLATAAIKYRLFLDPSNKAGVEYLEPSKRSKSHPR